MVRTQSTTSKRAEHGATHLGTGPVIPSVVGQYVLCFRRCACISTDACIHPLQVWLSTGRVSTRTHSLGEERMRAEPPHRRPTISALKVLRAPFQPLTHITPIPLSAASAKPSPLAYFQLQLCCLACIPFPVLPICAAPSRPSHCLFLYSSLPRSLSSPTPRSFAPCSSAPCFLGTWQMATIPRHLSHSTWQQLWPRLQHRARPLSEPMRFVRI